MKNLRFTLALLAVLSCVSRTVPEVRITESQSLPAPTNGVTLPNPGSFSFALIGDLHIQNGDTTRFLRVLKSARAEGDAFVLLLGDIVDTGEESDVQKVIEAIETNGWQGKVFPVLGNHDIFGEGWSSYSKYFGKSHYSVEVGNSKFIALDTGDGTLGKSQSEWLLRELNLSRPQHLFLFSHYLPVIPGQRTYLKLADELEAQRLMKWAKQYRVSAWLGAHYHSFIVSDIDEVKIVVAGGGGGRRMEPVKEFFFVQAVVDGERVDFNLRVVE